MEVGDKMEVVVASKDDFNAVEVVDRTWVDADVQVENAKNSGNTDERLDFVFDQQSSPRFMYIGDATLSTTVLLEEVGENKKPADNATVAPINAWGNTMFSSVEVELGGKIVSTDAAGSHTWRAYLYYLLNLSHADREGQASQAGFYTDQNFQMTRPKMDPTTKAVVKPGNPGWLNRNKMFSDFDTVAKAIKYTGKPVTLKHPVFTDLSSNGLGVLPGVPLRLVFRRHAPSFYLHTGADEDKEFTLKIVSSKLSLPCREMDHGLYKKLMDKMSGSPQKYRFLRLAQRVINMARGESVKEISDVFDNG